MNNGGGGYGTAASLHFLSWGFIICRLVSWAVQVLKALRRCRLEGLRFPSAFLHCHFLAPASSEVWLAW